MDILIAKTTMWSFMSHTGNIGEEFAINYVQVKILNKAIAWQTKLLKFVRHKIGPLLSQNNN